MNDQARDPLDKAIDHVAARLVSVEQDAAILLPGCRSGRVAGGLASSCRKRLPVCVWRYWHSRG